MPTYEYRCTECGNFDRRRPIAESRNPADCPTCGKPAERALSAPHVASGARTAGGQGGGGACGSGGCGHVH